MLGTFRGNSHVIASSALAEPVAHIVEPLPPVGPDPRVRALADTIIESQRKEISEMKSLITDLTSKR